MKQRAFKEQVFKLLFRADFNTKEELLEQVPIYFESGDLTVVPEDRARIEERLRAILDRLPEIDQQIAGRLKNWRPERIGKVERTVLRMTVYELQTDTGTPTAVVINDAIELARKFGQDGAGQFVNGVLAAFVPSNKKPDKPGTDKADTGIADTEKADTEKADTEKADTEKPETEKPEKS